MGHGKIYSYFEKKYGPVYLIKKFKKIRFIAQEKNSTKK
jgi:hypothetical protein